MKMVFASLPGGRGLTLPGGSVCLQGGIAIVTTKMNQILDLDIENQRVVVQPGVITLNLKNFIAKYGYLYQPDPASENPQLWAEMPVRTQEGRTA